jgi:benzil reductase ((S)-benzoin forming)
MKKLRKGKQMKNGFYLITGTSKGIGEALAKYLLEKDNTVLGIARSHPDALKSSRYHHLPFDLADTSRIGEIIVKMDEIVEKEKFDFVCLVSNAGLAEPLKSIEKSPADQIEAHIKICMIAPMVLTSMFIHRFIEDRMRKKIVFISSRLAFTALPGVSVYCSTKAGINMFAQCVGLEQESRENGFELISINPGMVDTTMQQVARSKRDDEFASAGQFKQAFKTGKLQEPSKVAEKISYLIDNKYEPGKNLSVSDILL